jgi:hypothetical protein
LGYKFIIILLLAFSTAAYSEDFEKTQLNFRMRSGDHGLEIREEIRAEKDHIQLSYFGIKATEIRLRYVDSIDAKEWRPQISHFVYQSDRFFFRPRLDYRYFLGETPDYFSFRSSVGSRIKINHQLDVFTEVNPIWDFGSGKPKDTRLDKIQFRLGITNHLKNLELSPFIQYETDGNLDHTTTFLGTTLTLTM